MKNNFLKITGLIALFFMLSSLSITKIIPEQVTLAQPVNIAIKVYYVLGGFGLIYLFLTLLKNRSLWFTHLRNRKVVKRNSLYLIPIIFIAYFIFHLFMILTENINNVDFTWTYISLNLNLLVERYIPLILIFIPFIPSISNYFPNKIALHPENATNYNRNSIYSKLGFDHFYALSGTDKADLLTNQETLDGKVSDAQTYRDVLEKIDPSKSQFFSVLTMQNHMPYTSYSGSSTITASGEGYSEAQNKLLENYVRKISDTDKATKEFLTELEKIDKKITLVFYGDHLSNVFPSDYAGFKEDPLNAYKTDYFIWTNKGNTTNKQVDLSSATFTPALFEATGSKVSPYYALLSDVMWEVPAAYNSPLSSTVTLTEEQSKRMEDLKLVQYDLTSGKHYLKEDSPFFKLEK